MRFFTIVCAALSISVSAYAQDSTELIGSPYGFSERYLFSSTVEGAEGLRVNPSVLGLEHFTTGRLSIFTQGPQIFSSWQSLRELDFSLNLSSLGLGYRRQVDPFLGRALNQFTVALGGGTKAFSMGVSRDFYSGDISNSATWNLGLLSRPARWLSLSYALRNINQPAIGNFRHDRTHIFGLGLRPFDGTDVLTLAGDYFKTRTRDWDEGTFRVGAQANFIKGLVLTGAYQHNLDDGLPLEGGLPFKNLLSVGVNFQYGYSENEYAALFGEELTGAVISSNFSAEKKDFLSLFGIVPKQIAELSIGGSLDDVRQSGFLGLDAQPSVHDYIRALDKAIDDETIGGVLLNIYPMAGSGITDFSGIVQEVASAVERVRRAGKRIVAYLPEGGGAAELYVASYAESVVAPREAAIGGYGVSISLLRMREFFKKYGIDWEVNAAGDYKTTFQTIFTDSTTPVQRAEIEGLVSSQYTQLIDRLQKGRNITLTEEQKRMLSGIITTDRAVEMDVIDFTGFKDRAKRELHSMVRGSSEDEYGTVNIFSQKKWNGEWGIRPQIAVVHVEGAIVTGESSGGGGVLPFFSSGATTGSETFTRQIKSAMYDKNIKAIVVRVNSGGGSALASDMMYGAIQKAAEKKPVIISFGDVAASGGYYLAVASKKIFANPATITGSIGVISSKPVVARLLDTLHINEETFKEGEHSDMNSIYRPYSAGERAMVEEYVNSTYQEFLNKVAKGRDISKDQAAALGGGRVYTGEQAQQQKLVDEFGGLYEAVREAQRQAELDDERYDVVFYSAGSSPALQDIFLEAALSNTLTVLGLDNFSFFKENGDSIK